MKDNQTGYPSIDKPWLKYYKENAEEEANNIPENKTVWDVIEERLKKYIDIPAIEFFGRSISRPDFIKEVYVWARAFKSLGVQENEVIPYYGVFTPDVCAMTLALNMIGACPYFLKLAISPEALAEETKDCRMAIVFDQMWGNVRNEFSRDRFTKVIIVKVTDAMPALKKQIVSVISGLKNKESIPKGRKYITVQEARKLAKTYNGEIKAPFVPNRSAFITSSSGTTINGVVKGTVATNESTLAQLRMGDASGVQFFPGERCLNHFPPTASTALNILFFLPLYCGMTIVMDPRVSEKDFYRQVISSRASVIVNTGSAWEAFFQQFEKEESEGKKFDFTCAKSWVIGGEGTDIAKYRKWKTILIRNGSPVGIASAYGASELFSCICTETPGARCDVKKPILSVGIPYAGISVGVFDKEGKELPYNQRGELWIKSNSAMKEYYNKPELTAQVKVNGWIHSGDLAEIDENGFVYIYGRVKDGIVLPSGREIYLFDLANKIKEKTYIDDAIVLPIPGEDNTVNVAVHIVWDKSVNKKDITDYLLELDDDIKRLEPEIKRCVYTSHETMLPYSPTTLKKDKNKMARQMDGYVEIVEGKAVNVRFRSTGDGNYNIENSLISNQHSREKDMPQR